MTTNRYLAEVLDGSRETLLAFADRVAHIAFVPKGFGDASSMTRLLRGQLALKRSQSLSTLLTIQDLDALQAAVGAVEFPPELCDLLVELVLDFEKELSAARRADPSFVPTRYLSTRTVVRLGKTLCAAVVLDYANRGRTRPLRVERRDFAALRFSLLLCGPSPSNVMRLLETETDPRERRQLEILRLERELFERCLARLREPRIAPAESFDEKLAEATKPDDLAEKSHAELVEVTRRLARAQERGQLEREQADERLKVAARLLSEQAITTALRTSTDPRVTQLNAALELSQLAAELDAQSAGQRPLARWLRGEALRVTQHALSLAPTDAGLSLSEWLSGAPPLSRAKQRSAERLARFERLIQLESELLSGGGAQAPARIDEQRRIAVERVTDDLAALWDGVLLLELETTLQRLPSDELVAIFEALGPVVVAVRADDARLVSLGGRPHTLAAAVVGRRLLPLLGASCERFDASDRNKATTQATELLATLKRFELLQAVPRAELLAALTQAMLRAEPDPAGAAYSADFEGYRQLRADGQRRSLCVTLAEICLKLSDEPAAQEHAPDLLRQLQKTLTLLPAPLAAEVVKCDLARIEAALKQLERWWDRLSEPGRASDEQLRDIAESRFVHVTRDEGALPRFALEAELLSELMPPADVSAVRSRVTVLERRSSDLIARLLEKTSDQRWQTLLSTSKS